IGSGSPRRGRAIAAGVIGTGIAAAAGFALAGAGGRADPRWSSQPPVAQPVRTPRTAGRTLPHSELAEDFLDRGLLADAAGEFRQALVEDRRDRRAWDGLSRVAAGVQRPGTALAMAAVAARQAPEDGAALRSLAVTQARAGSPEAAIRTLR